MSKKIWNLMYRPGTVGQLTGDAENPQSRSSALAGAETITKNGWRAWVEHHQTGEIIFMNGAECHHRGLAPSPPYPADAFGLDLAGELVFVGDLAAESLPDLVNSPSVQVQTADGRLVTIAGLTREECRAVAPGLFKPAHVIIGAPKN